MMAGRKRDLTGQNLKEVPIETLRVTELTSLKLEDNKLSNLPSGFQNLTARTDGGSVSGTFKVRKSQRDQSVHLKEKFSLIIPKNSIRGESLTLDYEIKPKGSVEIPIYPDREKISSGLLQLSVTSGYMYGTVKVMFDVEDDDLQFDHQFLARYSRDALEEWATLDSIPENDMLSTFVPVQSYIELLVLSIKREDDVVSEGDVCEDAGIYTVDKEGEGEVETLKLPSCFTVVLPRASIIQSFQVDYEVLDAADIPTPITRANENLESKILHLEADVDLHSVLQAKTKIRLLWKVTTGSPRKYFLKTSTKRGHWNEKAMKQDKNNSNVYEIELKNDILKEVTISVTSRPK